VHPDRREIAVRHFVCVAVALDLGLGFLLVEEVMNPVRKSREMVIIAFWYLTGTNMFVIYESS
jgi:hypothetical protein